MLFFFFEKPCKVQPIFYLLHRIEDWKTEMFLATFTGRNATDHLRAILDGLLAVKCSLDASEIFKILMAI